MDQSIESSDSELPEATVRLKDGVIKEQQRLPDEGVSDCTGHTDHERSPSKETIQRKKKDSPTQRLEPPEKTSRLIWKERSRSPARTEDLEEKRKTRRVVFRETPSLEACDGDPAPTERREQSQAAVHVPSLESHRDREGIIRRE